MNACRPIQCTSGLGCRRDLPNFTIVAVDPSESLDSSNGMHRPPDRRPVERFWLDEVASSCRLERALHAKVYAERRLFNSHVFERAFKKAYALNKSGTDWVTFSRPPRGEFNIFVRVVLCIRVLENHVFLDPEIELSIAARDVFFSDLLYSESLAESTKKISAMHNCEPLRVVHHQNFLHTGRVRI